MALVQKYVKIDGADRLHQGEILANVLQVGLNKDTLKFAYTGDEGVELESLLHPLCIVLSQDCDLEQDFRVHHDAGSGVARPLPNVLLCQLMKVPDLKSSANLNSDLMRPVKTNSNERFHCLESLPIELDLLDLGLPALGADFKKYFSVPTDEIYYGIELGLIQRRSKLTVPYAEQFSCRFANYLARIGLEQDYNLELDHSAAPALPVRPATTS